MTLFGVYLTGGKLGECVWWQLLFKFDNKCRINQLSHSGLISVFKVFLTQESVTCEISTFLDLLRYFTMQGFKFTWTSLQEVGWCSPKCKGYQGINWKKLKKFWQQSTCVRRKRLKLRKFLSSPTYYNKENLKFNLVFSMLWLPQQHSILWKHCQENVLKSWVTNCSCIWLEGAYELFIRYCRSKAAQKKVETWGRVRVREGKLPRHYSSVQRPNGR